ncbi:MAG: ImmA/IrrE family metallo-endopeptidase [Chloroflexi bacterium]|nr:ImmA/IrrE family metallo-endopeptidase [Chloroflexota bacterium]
MSYERLSRRLRIAREHARFSQTEAAQALGVTSAALSQYESGKRRVEALTLDQLSRLYGVPVSYFFGEEPPREDWEEALRLKAKAVSPESKAGIARLVAKVRDLEELYQRTETPLPGVPHPPFAPLPEEPFGGEEVADWAEKARRHYDLGMAPLTNLRDFLEAQGYKVFVVPFGKGEGHLSGLSFQHPRLGPIVAINGDQAYTRWPFTMAHEFAHRLYHYDRPAILSRAADARPLEDFADRFASHFLVPDEALHERLREQGIRVVSRPEQAVHLARYFGVSYRAMLHKLEQGRRLAGSSELFQAQPVALAQALGYPVRPSELGRRPLPPEERLPRVFLELAYRAVREGRLSERRVAEMLGLSDLELEERLNPELFGEPEEDA